MWTPRYLELSPATYSPCAPLLQSVCGSFYAVATDPSHTLWLMGALAQASPEMTLAVWRNEALPAAMDLAVDPAGNYGALPGRGRVPPATDRRRLHGTACFSSDREKGILTDALDHTARAPTLPAVRAVLQWFLDTTKGVPAEVQAEATATLAAMTAGSLLPMAHHAYACRVVQALLEVRVARASDLQMHMQMALKTLWQLIHATHTCRPAAGEPRDPGGRGP